VWDSIEAVHYFSSQPAELLYVAAIGIVGGLAALGFDRVPVHMKRNVRVFGWAGAASTTIALIGYLGFSFVRLVLFSAGSGGTHYKMLLPLSLSALAAYLWYVFYQAFKAGVS
jgi:hypothetical protein